MCNFCFYSCKTHICFVSVFVKTANDKNKAEIDFVALAIVFVIVALNPSAYMFRSRLTSNFNNFLSSIIAFGSGIVSILLKRI